MYNESESCAIIVNMIPLSVESQSISDPIFTSYGLEYPVS